jgi:hypothetical protein
MHSPQLIGAVESRIAEFNPAESVGSSSHRARRLWTPTPM